MRATLALSPRPSGPRPAGARRRREPARRARRRRGHWPSWTSRIATRSARPCASPSRSPARPSRPSTDSSAIFWDASADAGADAAAQPPTDPRRAPRARGRSELERRARPHGRRAGRRPREATQPGYSPEALLRAKAVRPESWSRGDLAAMERLLARRARRLATRRSRRLVPTPGRGLADLRPQPPARAPHVGRARLPRAPDARRRGAAPRLPLRHQRLDGRPQPASCCVRPGPAAGRAAHRGLRLQHRAVPLHPRALAPGKVRLTLDRLAAAVPDWSRRHADRRVPGPSSADHLGRAVGRPDRDRDPQRRPRPRRARRRSRDATRDPGAGPQGDLAEPAARRSALRARRRAAWRRRCPSSITSRPPTTSSRWSGSFPTCAS